MHGFNFNDHYPVLGPIYCFQFAPFDSFCLLSYIVKRFIHSRWFSASIYLSLLFLLLGILFSSVLLLSTTVVMRMNFPHLLPVV